METTGLKLETSGTTTTFPKSHCDLIKITCNIKLNKTELIFQLTEEKERKGSVKNHSVYSEFALFIDVNSHFRILSMTNSLCGYSCNNRYMYLGVDASLGVTKIFRRYFPFQRFMAGSRAR